MKVTSATFKACIVAKEGLPEKKLPVIALVGRSNVGKSSLINVLANRRELAKTSSTPGKTLTINFYEFNETFYLVDLPGYGYAKASRVTRERIQKMMNEFFEAMPELLAIVQILDVRHQPSNMDLSMLQWIQDQGFRYFPVLTKADKLGQQELVKMSRDIRKKVGSEGAIQFSCKTKQGREEVLDFIQQLLENPDGAQAKARDKGPRPEQKRSGRREGGGGGDRQGKGKPQNPGQNQGGGNQPRRSENRPPGTGGGQPRPPSGNQGGGQPPRQPAASVATPATAPGGQPTDGAPAATPGQAAQQPAPAQGAREGARDQQKPQGPKPGGDSRRRRRPFRGNQKPQSNPEGRNT